MRRLTVLGSLCLLILGFGAALSVAQDKPMKKPVLGKKVPALMFKDIRYLPRSLSDFSGKRYFVIYASNLSCPLVARYWPRLKELNAQYQKQGFQFLSLNVEPADSVKDIAEQALRYDVPFPFVQDMEGECVKALGLHTTSQVVILDAKRRLLYSGRVDDQYRLGGARPKASKTELKDALAAISKGQGQYLKSTPVDGCKIAEPAPKAKEAKYNYVDHAAPLIRKHCLDCHKPGGLAPFHLVSYEDAKKNAATIAYVVSEGRMPPWYGSERHKGFSNYRGMTAAERQILSDWARAGAPSGDLSKLKAVPLKAKQEWQIGKPDWILKVAETVKLPADGYVPYKYFTFFGKFPHDRWIESIEIKPKNTRVLHHCNMIYTFFNNKGERSRTTFVTGVVPGSGATFTPKDVAIKIPKGATLVLQAHYTTTGKPEEDQLQVGFRFARKRVRKQLHHVRAGNRKFAIPAGASHHEVRASATLKRRAELVAVFAHMHLRGKAMRFVAHHKEQQQELLTIPNYSFDWQQSYKWPIGQKVLKKGTRIECIAHFDNSAFNPFNPDPKKTVKYGLQTYHEMMYGFVFFVDADEQLNIRVDPKTGKALPKTQPKTGRKKRFFNLSPR